MYAFATVPHGALRCLADFQADRVLNIDFIDPDRDTVPFHLSLRPDEGKIVVNRRHAAGWRREIVWTHSFAPGPVPVEIRFEAGAVAVALDGRPLGRFDAWPRPARGGRFGLRHGFPGLARIGRVRLSGGWQAGSLSLDCPGLPVPDPSGQLTSGLAIRFASDPAAVPSRLRVFLPDDAPEPHVDIPLLRIAVEGHPDPRGRIVEARLPGRIWAGAPGPRKLVLLSAAEAALAEGGVTPEAVRAAIVRAAADGLWAQDQMAALGAVEHVGIGGWLAALPAPTRAQLVAVAARHRLADWLEAGQPAPPGPRAPARAPAGPVLPAVSVFEALRDNLVQALNRPDDAADPGARVLQLARGLRAADLSETERGDLVRRLTEPAIVAGRMPALLRAARDAGLLPLPEGEGDWVLSTTLPADHALGWFDAIHARLRRLDAPAARSGWPVTPAIGWTVVQIVRMCPDQNGLRPDLRQRRDILGAFLDYLDRLSGDYWSRAPCRALIEAMVAMLTDAAGLEPQTARRARRVAIRLWGLSPPFWAALRAACDGASDDWPDDLAEAASICDGLVAAALASPSDRLAIDALLTAAGTLGMAEAVRFRRELLGPSGLPDGQPEPRALRLRGLDPDEGCLRALLHPLAPGLGDQGAVDPGHAPAAAGGAGHAGGDTPGNGDGGDDDKVGRDGGVGDPGDGGDSRGDRRGDCGGDGGGDGGDPGDARDGASGLRARQTRALLRGMRAAHAQVPAPRLPELEARVMAEARELARAPTAARLEGWAASLLPLSGPDQGHAGVTLALGLAAALARDRQTGLAARLIAAPPLCAPLSGSLSATLADPRFAPAADSATLAAPGQALQVLARHDPVLAGRAAQALGLPPVLPPTAPDPLSRSANPLHDTLVAVYSCRANLPTRVAALRDTWLSDLTAMGIPWLVFTGDGDGGRDGDVVHLDAPDDYEGLPDKTLAMVRWVLAQTGISRMVKVDDDCYLHAAAWFGDLAHLRHDYLGRVLTLRPGQMDRTWHIAKSASPRGRQGLDKSPEPARYADGGSGYMLSRRAMEALVAAADSPEGQALRQVSFMEDKQTGDLLALRGIRPVNEGYCTAVWRRNGPGARVVPAWENGVLPFRGSPLKLAHLDGTGDMERVHRQARADRPAPGKIWPSWQPALFGSRTNALDLISSPARLVAACRAPVAVVACLRNEAQILPSFLDHYRRQGVEAFLIADNGSTDGTPDLLAQAPDVALFSVDTEYGWSQYGVAWQQAMLSQFRLDRWSLVADADELLVWSDDPGASLPDLLSGPDFAGVDAARVLMLDMYPRGSLAGVTLASGDPFAETGFVDRVPFLRQATGRGPFSDAETLTSALRHRLLPGSRPELFVAQKIALLRYRPWMRLSAGLHYVAGTRLAARDLLFGHFKYTAAFHARARAEVQRRQHFNGAEEYRKYLDLMSEGRDILHDPAVSVPWRECPAVRQVLAGGRIGA